MTGALERGVVRLLKIPPEPRIASAATDGVEAFRASRRYYRYRLVGWALTQASTAAGILAFLWFAGLFDFETPVQLFEKLAGQDVKWLAYMTSEHFLGLSIMDWIFVAEIVGIVGFLAQLPISFAMMRLDYRLRWYVLTDRSLHIRTGVRKVKEQTLTFGNIQNVRLEQGPVERLFGFAGVKVRTAGGGSGDDSSDGDADRAEDKALHIGWLRGLDNAEAVRDRILDAVRRYRDAGLGIPDDSTSPAAPEDLPALAAARELLEEIRSWRRSVGT